jgi:hypothetical protein
LIHYLANDPEPRVPQLSEEETAELFRAAGLEDRLRKADAWPFGNAGDGE